MRSTLSSDAVFASKNGGEWAKMDGTAILLIADYPDFAATVPASWKSATSIFVPAYVDYDIGVSAGDVANGQPIPPPAGFLAANYWEGMSSIRSIDFAGVVDGNDSLRNVYNPNGGIPLTSVFNS